MDAADKADRRLSSKAYLFNIEKVPQTPGIYVFGRRFGNQFEALYVGKASRLRGRTKGQLNNLKLMQHLKSAKNGGRILLIGQFVPRPGKMKKSV